jgi:hypothetical protein
MLEAGLIIRHSTMRINMIHHITLAIEHIQDTHENNITYLSYNISFIDSLKWESRVSDLCE